MKVNITYEQALAKASPKLQKQIKWSVELLRKSERRQPQVIDEDNYRE